VVSLQLTKGRKIIAAGLAVLAFLAMIYLFRSASRSTHAVHEALQLKQLKLAKYHQKLLEIKVVERELLTLKNTMKQAEAGLLTGETPSLAAAEIQEIVSSIADAAGGQIKTVRIVQPDRSGELTQALYKLDSSAKLLRIAKLEIRSRRVRRGRGSSVNLLTTTMRVEGFVKKMET
jgi:hypothetical protein